MTTGQGQNTIAALREISTAARPLIEQWLDVGEQIAALRDTATAKGLDWSALKSLLKAQIQDERDEGGDGKRVRKMLEKADFATAYADMLGLNMNEQNISEADEPAVSPIVTAEEQTSARRAKNNTLSSGQELSVSTPAATGIEPEDSASGVGRTLETHNEATEPAPVADTSSHLTPEATPAPGPLAGENGDQPTVHGETDGTRDGGQHVRPAHDQQHDEAPVSGADGRGEGQDAGDQGQGAGAPGTDRHVRPEPGTLARQDQDGRSGHVGREARHEVGIPLVVAAQTEPVGRTTSQAGGGAVETPADQSRQGEHDRGSDVDPRQGKIAPVSNPAPAAAPFKTDAQRALDDVLSGKLEGPPDIPRPQGCLNREKCGSSTWRRRCHVCEKAWAAQHEGAA